MSSPTLEPGTVPNGSEPFGTGRAAPGRIPVQSDEELAALADRLLAQHKRPPSIQELVDASGGCQRQRAVRTLQTLRRKQAEKTVRNQLIFDPGIEDEVKKLAARWLGLAANQLAVHQAGADEAHELALRAATDRALELEMRVRQESSRVHLLEAEVELGLQRLQQLQTELDQTRAVAQAQTALASERQRLLDSLLPLLPGQISTGVSA